MLPLLALLVLISGPACSIAQNEPPEVVGSEVRVLPSSPAGEQEPTIPPSTPEITEPPSESPAITTEGGRVPSTESDPFARSEIAQSTPGTEESSSGREPSSGEPGPSDQPSSSAPVEFELSLNFTSSGSENGSAQLEPVTDSSRPSSKERIEDSTQQSSSISQQPSSVSQHPSLISQQPPLISQQSSSISPQPNISLFPEIPGQNGSDLSNSSGRAGAAEPNRTTDVFLLPSKISRVRVTIIGFTGKPVRTFNLSADQVLYQMKVFWLEPDSWQDIGWNPSDRFYELFCWLATNGGFGRDLYRGNVSGALITYSQWYAVPEIEDDSKRNVSVHCGIRPVNGAGKGGDWVFGDPANVREAPVFLRGFENVNVRGWTRDEVVRFVKNQKRLDAPQPKAAAKAKSRRDSN